MTLEISRQIFKKRSNIKFDENPYCRGRVVSSGRTDRQTDGHDEAFHNFANTPKIKKECITYDLQYKKFYFFSK
jgi:Zn-finger nucleic acid-binding protein